MESSPDPPSLPIDPYVLEFAVNFKWLLHYATHLLDPTVETHYPALVADVANMERVLARTSFAGSCTLNDLPFGVLRLSREMALYLLVCDHLLGGCPPTMHPFLRRAYGSPRRDERVQPRTAKEKEKSGHKDADSAISSRKNASGQRPRQPRAAAAVAHADLNVSFPSGGSSSNIESSDDARSLDGRPVGMVNDNSYHSRSNSSRGATSSAVDVDGGGAREAQAALILLRWLCVEGVLAEDEIAATLDADSTATSAVSVETHASVSHAELCSFRRHQRLARHLAELVPFYLGAHVLISRSLLLQYSSTLLSADAVMQHVQRLQMPLSSSSRYQPYFASHPPSSVEGALLEWFQVVVDSAKEQLRVPQPYALSTASRLEDCSALCGFVQSGPFCPDALDPAERDFFRLVQSGECVCVALWFYCPDVLPLAELSRALREAEHFMTLNPPERTLYSSEEVAERFQMHQSVCYWTAVFAAARALGVTPLLLTPTEVVRFGRTALPLHLFVFVQQLFAVLATKAEEDVRVSADTAWWEQLGNSDGYTELAAMAAEARRGGSGENGTWPSDSMPAAVPGAQHVLRQSMRDSFPLGAFQEPNATAEARKGAQEVEDEEEVVLTEAPHARPKSAMGGTESTAGVSAVVPQFLVNNEVNPSAVAAHPSPLSVIVTAGKEERRGPHAHSVRSPRSSSSVTSSSSATTTTHFTVEFAGTQRGRPESLTSSTSGAMETPTSALRPMVPRQRTSECGSSTAAVAQEVHSYSFTTFTSVTTLDRRAADRAERSGALPVEVGRKVEIADRVVDTYARTPDDVPLFVKPEEITEELLLTRLPLAMAQQESGSSRRNSDSSPASSAACRGEQALGADSDKSKVPLLLPPQEERKRPLLSDRPALVAKDEKDEQPSSPQLRHPKATTTAKPRALFTKLGSPTAVAAAALEAVAESSASSFSYSDDFVVQSVPEHTAASPREEEGMVAVKRSASFNTPALPLPQQQPTIREKETPAVAPSQTLPPPASSNDATEKPPAPLSGSSMAIRKFNASNAEDENTTSSEDAVVNGRDAVRDDEGTKESSLPTPSSLSTKPSSPSFSSAPSTPTQQEKRSTPSSFSPLAPSSAGPMEVDKEVQTQSPTSLGQQQQHSVSAAPAPSAPLISVAHTLGSRSSGIMHVDHALPANKDTAAAPLLPPTPSLTDIAVEDDGTSTVSDGNATHGVRESFPTPTEREEADRLRAMADPLTSTVSLSQEVTPVRGSGTAPARAWLPGIVSPSPVRFARVRPMHSAEAAVVTAVAQLDVASSHRTLSEDSNVDGLSPLTPALTQSASEVFGTDYASLLEGAASSYASPGQHRRSRAYDDESWFSSVSHPHRQSIQSNAESMMSLGSMRDSAQVKELVERLRGMAVSDLEDRERDELRDALARQQEVVMQLTNALQERRGRFAVRAFPAAARPSVRRRQVHLRLPPEEVDNGGGLRAVRVSSAGRSALTDSSSPVGVRTQQRQRQRSVSAVTMESHASPSHSMQSEGDAQLAEPDVSSLLANILLPEKSESPARTRHVQGAESES